MLECGEVGTRSGLVGRKALAGFYRYVDDNKQVLAVARPVGALPRIVRSYLPADGPASLAEIVKPLPSHRRPLHSPDGFR